MAEETMGRITCDMCDNYDDKLQMCGELNCHVNLHKHRGDCVKKKRFVEKGTRPKKKVREVSTFPGDPSYEDTKKKDIVAAPFTPKVLSPASTGQPLNVEEVKEEKQIKKDVQDSMAVPKGLVPEKPPLAKPLSFWKRIKKVWTN